MGMDEFENLIIKLERTTATLSVVCCVFEDCAYRPDHEEIVKVLDMLYYSQQAVISEMNSLLCEKLESQKVEQLVKKQLDRKEV